MIIHTASGPHAAQMRSVYKATPNETLVSHPQPAP